MDEDLSKGDLMRIQKKIKEEILERVGIDPEKVDLNLYLAKKKEIDGPSYMILFQNTEFLLSTVLSPTQYQLFGLIRSLVQYENLIPYSTSQLVKLSKQKRATVYRDIGVLKDYGILVAFQKEGRRNEYNLYLNPELAWKGKLQNKARVMKVFSEDGKFSGFKEKPANRQQLDLFDESYDVKSPKQKRALAAKKEDEWAKGKAIAKRNPNDDSVEYFDNNGMLIRNPEDIQ